VLKRRLEDAVSELENHADKLAEKAEALGELKYIFQSNSFRKSSKEKKEELKEIDLKIECVLKKLKD
jgi:DNA-binding ferritin-like protein